MQPILPLATLTLLLGLSAPAPAQAEPDLSTLSSDTYENGYSPAVRPVAGRTTSGHSRRHVHRHLVAHRSAAQTTSPAL